ncbi:MAG: hypothetical protein PUF98_00570 [Oscillibacter sp.]|nr:hypothetical protein [Oscillibacter sp.]
MQVDKCHIRRCGDARNLSADFRRSRQEILDFVGSAYRPLFRMGELAFCRPTHPQAPFLLTMNGRFLFDETKRKWGFNPARHSRAF